MPPDADITPGAVHEEERVGVRRDGSVVRELDRVEQPPVEKLRNWWPWAISVLLLLALVGLAVWYLSATSRRRSPQSWARSRRRGPASAEQDGFKTQIIRRVSTRRPGTVVGSSPRAEARPTTARSSS